MTTNHFSGPLAVDLADFVATLEASASANKATLTPCYSPPERWLTAGPRTAILQRENQVHRGPRVGDVA